MSSHSLVDSVRPLKPAMIICSVLILYKLTEVSIFLTELSVFQAVCFIKEQLLRSAIVIYLLKESI